MATEVATDRLLRKRASSSVGELISEFSIGDKLHCQICKEYLSEPKLLSCLHYFCRKCIEPSVALSSPSECLKCKICDKSTTIKDNDVDNLPTLYQLKTVIETYKNAISLKKAAIECGSCIVNEEGKATKYCRECNKFLCIYCCQVHEKLKDYRTHNAIPIDELLDDLDKCTPTADVSPICKSHGQELKYYCSEIECMKLVCRDCYTTGIHKDHNVKTILEEEEDTFEWLKTSLKHVKTHTLDKDILNIDRVMEEVEEQAKQAEKTLDNIITGAVQTLEEIKEQCRKRIDQIKEEKVEALEAQKRKLCKLKSDINESASTVHMCLLSKNNATITSCQEFFTCKIQEDIKRLETIDKEPVTVPDISVKEYFLDQFPQYVTEKLQTFSPMDPEKCEITGIGAETANINETNYFIVEAKYENGRPCIEQLDIKIELKSLLSGTSTCHYEVTKCNNKGSYKIEYVPCTRGKHELTVTINGLKIPYSKNLMVYMPPKGLGKPLNTININRPYQVAFTSTNQMFVTSNNIMYCENVYEREKAFKNFGDITKEKPTGIAISDDDIIYISYEENHKVKKYRFDSAQNIADSDLSLVKAKNQEKVPRLGRLAYNNKTSELFCCDRGRLQVYVLSSDLTYTHSIGENIRCSDIALDKSGIIYITDKSKNCIFRFNSYGNELDQLKLCPNTLSEPRGLLIQNSFLYVADRNNCRIAIFSLSGEIEVVHSYIYNKQDLGSIASDKHGHIYVCNERLNCIYVF